MVILVVGAIVGYLIIGALIYGAAYQANLVRGPHSDDAISVPLFWPLFLAFFLGKCIMSICQSSFKRRIDE